MDTKMMKKMIQRSFHQYGCDSFAPLSEEEYERLIKRVLEKKEKEPKEEWYEMVEDIVYEYITNEERLTE
ncbi:YqzH family protein [Bacillus alveayuensis]|jgi:hypothetical protein|uniref:YqzH-like protein n=1 Tax=Aeribacillus alveayuensis TaxID=279215 RepID=A0ABT9VKD6_9BACI|nr:YqzH family protein [Bacillus alveayuensis]MDQ0161443.1 hypothetical protein [Bacillus alveayuensis]